MGTLTAYPTLPIYPGLRPAVVHEELQAELIPYVNVTLLIIYVYIGA